MRAFFAQSSVLKSFPTRSTTIGSSYSSWCLLTSNTSYPAAFASLTRVDTIASFLNIGEDITEQVSPPARFPHSLYVSLERSAIVFNAFLSVILYHTASENPTFRPRSTPCFAQLIISRDCVIVKGFFYFFGTRMVNPAPISSLNTPGGGRPNHRRETVAAQSFHAYPVNKTLILFTKNSYFTSLKDVSSGGMTI